MQTNWVHCCCLCLQACLPAPDPQPHARLPLASPTTAKSRLPPTPPPTHLRVRLYLVHVKRWVAGDGADFASRRTSHQRAWRHLSQHSGARRHLQVWQGFCWFGGALAGSCTQVDSLAARCLPLPFPRQALQQATLAACHAFLHTWALLPMRMLPRMRAEAPISTLSLILGCLSPSSLPVPTDQGTSAQEVEHPCQLTSTGQQLQEGPQQRNKNPSLPPRVTFCSIET